MKRDPPKSPRLALASIIPGVAASVASTTAANATAAAEFQEKVRKIANRQLDPQELQREHRRQLEEEEEKARAVAESLEFRVRKSFSANLGRFVGSSDAVEGQTVGQACVESSPIDTPCGAEKSDSCTQQPAASESKTSGAHMAKAASAPHLRIDVGLPTCTSPDKKGTPRADQGAARNAAQLAAWFKSISDNEVGFRTGSTAVTALVVGDHLVVANVGDSPGRPLPKWTCY